MLQLLAVVQQLAEQANPPLPALAPQMLNPLGQPADPAAMAERLRQPLPLLAERRRQVLDPDVAVVNLAKIGLDLLDRRHILVEPALVCRLANLHRVTELLRRNPHLVMPLVVLRIGKRILVVKKLAQILPNLTLQTRE